LIDESKPVRIVWNGAAETADVKNGKIALHSPTLHASDHAKTPGLPGSIGGIYDLPFAIVTGTSSTDPVMKALCLEKSETLVKAWQDWQHQTPRVFKDSDLSDADAARYSLLLIGGPDANLVTHKLAAKLPLKVATDAITIGQRGYPVTDGRVTMIQPSPLNPQRYVVVVAATSPTGLQFWSPTEIRNSALDFVIADGHVAAAGQQAHLTDLWVAGGWFDRDWALDESLVRVGDQEARAKSLSLSGPLEPGILEAYLGKYDLGRGGELKVSRQGNKLMAAPPGSPAVELVPAGADTFYIFDGSLVVVFARDASGKVNSFTATRPSGKFSGRRVD